MIWIARTRIALLAVTLLTVLAVLMAACGGGDDDDGGDDGGATDAPTAAPTDAGDDDGGDDGGGETPGVFREVYPINETFWHQAFKIEIGDAVYEGTEPDFFGQQEFTLTLEATFTNEGPEQSFLDSSAVLVTPSDTYNARFGTYPSVPGGGLSESGSFEFRVGDQLEIDGAYLLVGSGSEQRARVPLGPGGGELVSLEPSDGPLTGTLSISLLDLEFKSMELRADYPSSHSEVEAGKLALTLYFDAMSRRTGNWSVFATEFLLMQPDGSSIAVDWSELPGLPGSDVGLVTEGLYLRFLVDDPAEGAYVLQYNPAEFWLEDGDPTELTLEFEI